MLQQNKDIFTSLMIEEYPLFHNENYEKCHDICTSLLPNGKLTVFLIDEEGRIVR